MANMDDHYRMIAAQPKPKPKKKREPLSYANELMSRDYIVRQALKHRCRRCGAAVGAPCVSIDRTRMHEVLRDVHGERSADGMRAVQRQP